MWPPPSPFQRLLGPAFDRLPAPLRLVHGLAAPLATAGQATVEPAAGLAARLLARLAGLPKSGDIVEIAFVPLDDGERWSRRFDDRRYTSTIHADGSLLRERFGPFDVLYRLAPDADGLTWTAVAWRLLGLPLPWPPRIEARESADGKRFRFDISIAFPLFGPVVRYRGWLAPTGGQSPAGRSPGSAGPAAATPP